jgi:hypothetical protein
MCFNIITGSKCYSLFPILSSLIKPSLGNFRIALVNGLFSPVGIGGLIPSLRTVLESFLPHTAHQFFSCPVSYLTNGTSRGSTPFFGLTKEVHYMSFKLKFGDSIWSNNPFYFVLSFFPPSEEKIPLSLDFLKGNYLGFVYKFI